MGESTRPFDPVKDRLGAAADQFTDEQVNAALRAVEHTPGNRVLLAVDYLLQSLEEN